jgi:hypothetical protein
VFQKLRYHVNIQLCLPSPHQQHEADGSAADDAEVDFMDIFKINEDMVHRRREWCGGVHIVGSNALDDAILNPAWVSAGLRNRLSLS